MATARTATATSTMTGTTMVAVRRLTRRRRVPGRQVSGQFGFQEQGVDSAVAVVSGMRAVLVGGVAPQGGRGAGLTPVVVSQRLVFWLGHQAGVRIGRRLGVRVGPGPGRRLGEDRGAERDSHVARPGAVHRLGRKGS